MAHSPLLGTDSAPQEPFGRDTRSLGPSDISDSGSDLAGIATGGQAALPLEEALQDAEVPEAAPDIDADRIVTPHRDSADEGDAGNAGDDATEPPRPNPEPDAPAPTEPADPEAPPAEPGDDEARKPGRTAALLRARP